MQVLVSPTPITAKDVYTMRPVDTGKGVVYEVPDEHFTRYQQVMKDYAAFQKELFGVWKNPPKIQTK